MSKYLELIPNQDLTINLGVFHGELIKSIKSHIREAIANKEVDPRNLSNEIFKVSVGRTSFLEIQTIGSPVKAFKVKSIILGKDYLSWDLEAIAKLLQSNL